MKNKRNITLLLLLIGMSLLVVSNQTQAASIAGPTTQRMPRIVVYNGNGAYHTDVSGFTTNASTWGYEVYTTNILDIGVLDSSSMLILNGNDYLTEEEITLVARWWDTGNFSIWFAGESDYGGLWYPTSMNLLSVELGLNVIIQDDALGRTISGNEIYRPALNVPNTDWAGTITSGVENISMHGPTAVCPYSGNDTGINNMPTWDSLPYTDWIMNSSEDWQIQDQDFDGDNIWEGYPTFINGSWTAAAVEWHTGTWNESKAIWTGESMFAEYKNMFSDVLLNSNDIAIQNIGLTHNLLDWAVGNTLIDVDQMEKTVMVTVFNGNGAYHTDVSGLISNASSWGYYVNLIEVLTPEAIALTDILILNGNDFLLEEERATVKDWWNLGNHTIWFAGESDYGGLWNPEGLNLLSVELGLNVIIQDDFINDARSVDGQITYYPVQNVPNTDWTGTITAGVENISLHGPAVVCPYSGNETGINNMPTWDSLPYVDWIMNSSEYSKIVDQDFDNDNIWEGHPINSIGSWTVAAVEWHTGPWNESKAIWTGESMFAEYQNMFSDVLPYGNENDIAIQNIGLTQNIFTWAEDASVFSGRIGPNVIVYNGNGAYHTDVSGLVSNATTWGYNVYTTPVLSANLLEVTDILILNGNDYMTEGERWLVKTWWNSGNHTIWFAGESDYGGLWTPEGMNLLSVELGLNVIIQDDALHNTWMVDGQIIYNGEDVPNTDWAGTITAGVENISLHGPTVVCPYSGNETGINDMPTWDSLPYVDWIMNSSEDCQIHDQDFDNDNIWEGYPTFINGSWTVTAVEWHSGTWNESKAIWTGESMFAEYKNMFSEVLRNNNEIAIQNIELTQNLFTWAAPGFTEYHDYISADDLTPPMIVDIEDSTTETVLDNEEIDITCRVHDFGHSLNGISSVSVEYSVDGADKVSASTTQEDLVAYATTIGPFAAGASVDFYLVAIDAAGWTYKSETFSFDVTYSDTVGPEITNVTADITTIYPDEIVGVSAIVADIGGADEIISGIDEVICQYTIDDGTTWTDLVTTADGNTYYATIPGQPDSTIVSVRFIATDVAGNTVTSAEIYYEVILRQGSHTATSTSTTIIITTDNNGDGSISGFNFSGFILFTLIVGTIVFTQRRRR